MFPVSAMTATKPLYTVMKAEAAKRGMNGTQFMVYMGRTNTSFRLAMNVDPRLTTLQSYAAFLKIPTCELIQLIEEEEARCQNQPS